MDQRVIKEKIEAAAASILAYCRARTPNSYDAEDLAQEILLTLSKALVNLREDRAFYGFMRAVAGNVYRQWYRRQLRINECAL